MKLLACATSACILALPAFAGEMIASRDGKNAVIEPCPPVARLLFRATTSYTFESDFKNQGPIRNADGDAFSNEFELGYRIRLGEGWPTERCGEWNLRLGAIYSRHDFGNSGGLPIPNHLQAAAGIIALEYLVEGQPAILLETHPGVFFENDIDGDNFDSPTTIVAAHRFGPNFTVFAGATYGQFRDYPIFPAAGFIWNVCDRFSIKAVYPTAQLIYKCSEHCEAYVGGEHVYGAFRADRDPTRPARLNHAVLEYYEYRAGAGLRFGNGTLTGEIGGGWAFERGFDYHRTDRAFRTDEGAPFIKAELRAAF